MTRVAFISLGNVGSGAALVVQRRDFIEGVRALIADKDDKPVRNPAMLAGATDAMLDEFFAPLPAEE